MKSNNIYFLTGTDNRPDKKMKGSLDSYPSALDPGCNLPTDHLGSFSHLAVALSCADHDDPWEPLRTRLEDTPPSEPSMLWTFPSATSARSQHGIGH